MNIIGILGSLGGVTKKWLRRVVLPIILTTYAYSYLHNIWILTMLSIIGVLSMGYGIPDETDEGSRLGKYWLNKLGDKLEADLATRGTIAFLLSVSCISISVVRNNPMKWLIYSILFSTIYMTFSWQSLGTIKFRKIRLNISDLISYSALGLYVVLLVRG